MCACIIIASQVFFLRRPRLALPSGSTRRTYFSLFSSGTPVIRKGTPGVTSKGVFEEVELYDPKTDTWRAGPRLPLGLHGIYPIVYKNQILITGGCDRVDRYISTHSFIYKPQQ